MNDLATLPRRAGCAALLHLALGSALWLRLFIPPFIQRSVRAKVLLVLMVITPDAVKRSLALGHRRCKRGTDGWRRDWDEAPLKGPLMQMFHPRGCKNRPEMKHRTLGARKVLQNDIRFHLEAEGEQWAARPTDHSNRFPSELMRA